MNPWRPPSSGQVADVVRRWTVLYVLVATGIAGFAHVFLFQEASANALTGTPGPLDGNIWLSAFLIGFVIGLPFYGFNVAICALDVIHPQAAQRVRFAFWVAVRAVMHERAKDYDRSQAQQAADKRQEQMMTRAFETAMDNRARSQR